MTTDPNRTAIERSLRRRIYVLGFSSFLFFILLAFASTRKLITLHAQRMMFLVYIALATILYLVLTLKARKKLRISTPDFTKPPDAEEQKRLRRSIRSLKRFLVFYALALILGLWVTRDELSLTTLVGVAMSLLIQTRLILTIRRLKRRLAFE